VISLHRLSQKAGREQALPEILECGGKRSAYGVRRQSGAAAALWIPNHIASEVLSTSKAVSPDESGLPPHSKVAATRCRRTPN